MAKAVRLSAPNFTEIPRSNIKRVKSIRRNMLCCPPACQSTRWAREHSWDPVELELLYMLSAGHCFPSESYPIHDDDKIFTTTS